MLIFHKQVVHLMSMSNSYQEHQHRLVTLSRLGAMIIQKQNHCRCQANCKFSLNSWEWLLYLKHVVHTLSNINLFAIILGATSHHTPLKYRCPIKTSNRIRHV